MDPVAEKFSIKSMLFTKSLPNYVIPIPTKGYKVYGCTDCGDKFLLQSSYLYHINRKSMQITFTCRICNTRNVFFNRCTLLAHIRSHAFKTATININDIIIEPLPLSHFKIVDKTAPPLQKTCADPAPATHCHHCKETLKVTLADHLMDHKNNQSITCPFCAFTVPTKCAFSYHLHLHLEKSPLICPECGVVFPTKLLLRNNNHQCLGIKILRASARFQCEVSSCVMLYHPEHHSDHLLKRHVKQVFKCPLCVVACFSGPMIESHLQNNHQGNPKTSPVLFYQCDLCPGRLVLENQLSNHLMGHEGKQVYPCRKCGIIHPEQLTLVKHYIDVHGPNQKDTSAILSAMLAKHKYSVVKKCEKCQRCFTYRCSYNYIDDLPTNCPYNCSNSTGDRPALQNTVTPIEPSDIKCFICKHDILNDWAVIKKHFYYNHRNVKCVDVQVNLNRIDVPKKPKSVQNIEKSRTRTRNKPKRYRGVDLTDDSQTTLREKDKSKKTQQPIMCKKCDKPFDTKKILVEHLITHRDPYMAYQCMECGGCFAVRPSFSTHLLIEHNISDSEEYITKNQCYNKDALLKNDLNPVFEGPLEENQCNICKEQFPNAEDLEKHYRVHGMAFLRKNTSSQSNNLL